MRKMMAALVICLCLFAGAAAAETITLTGTYTAPVTCTGGDLTLVLRNATLEEGLWIIGGSATLELYGDNEIHFSERLVAPPDSTSVVPVSPTLYISGGDLSIVSGDPDATLLVTGSDGYRKNIIPAVIQVKDGSLTIAASNVTILGSDGDTNYMDGPAATSKAQEDPNRPLPRRTISYMTVHDVVEIGHSMTISGNHVHILGGTITGGIVSNWNLTGGNATGFPEFSTPKDAVLTISGHDVWLRGYIVPGETNYACALPTVSVIGAALNSMTVEVAGEDGVWSEIDGSPFTAQTDVSDEGRAFFQLRTFLANGDLSVRPGYSTPTPTPTPVAPVTPTPAPTAAPAVPATGDGGHPALWLLMALTALISLTAWKARRA